MVVLYDSSGFFGRYDMLPYGDLGGLQLSPSAAALFREPYPGAPSTLRVVVLRDSSAMAMLASRGVYVPLWGIQGHEYFTDDKGRLAAFVEEIAKVNPGGYTTAKPNTEAVAGIFGPVAGDEARGGAAIEVVAGPGPGPDTVATGPLVNLMKQPAKAAAVAGGAVAVALGAGAVAWWLLRAR